MESGNATLLDNGVGLRPSREKLSFHRLTKEGVGNLIEYSTCFKRSPTHSFLILGDDKSIDLNKIWEAGTLRFWMTGSGFALLENES
ncbi:hypothetical protein IX91_13640 [Vibrio tubiashii ATCC 19109]|uniref:Uncharacterized protein n=1 Tax=Vibrio tubiashii ATCC 19109 TaxID=1051646 RepID=A0A0A0SLL8_9VIBR|nr:hypothetical protein IX91_13640 [Vibrio tubiashii ATCC 19109]